MFSTTTGWPRTGASCPASHRARTSLTLPMPAVTTILTGRSGYAAIAVAARRRPARRITSRFMAAILAFGARAYNRRLRNTACDGRSHVAHRRAGGAAGVRALGGAGQLLGGGAGAQAHPVDPFQGGHAPGAS